MHIILHNLIGRIHGRIYKILTINLYFLVYHDSVKNLHTTFINNFKIYIIIKIARIRITFRKIQIYIYIYKNSTYRP